jgi:hypothetical protein
MSKYAALGEYLRRQTVGRVQLTFADIERIIGGKLPASQRYPAWWSNNPSNNTMTQVWLDAGFETEQVDIAARKLVFCKAPAGSRSHRAAEIASPRNTPHGEHPLFARLQGTAQLAAGVDVTAPADPGWGELAYGDDVARARG